MQVLNGAGHKKVFRTQNQWSEYHWLTQPTPTPFTPNGVFVVEQIILCFWNLHKTLYRATLLTSYLWPTFVPVRLVCLTVRQVYTIAL